MVKFVTNGLTKFSKLPKTPRIALLTIVAIGMLSTTVFGAVKGFEYFSAKKLEAEVSGQVGADDQGGSEAQDEVDDAQDAPDEEEKEVSEPSGEVAGETISAPTPQQQTPVSQPEPKQETTPTPETAPSPEPEPEPESEPEPTPTPTPTTTPTPTPSCCNEGTIKLLGEIAYKIASINRAIDSLKTSNQREYEEKSKCLNNPDYDPLKVGLDGHKRLVAQCLDLHQGWIDKNNAEINRLQGEYGEYDRQKNSILAACPDCVDAWTAIVQAYRDKGWRI